MCWVGKRTDISEKKNQENVGSPETVFALSCGKAPPYLQQSALYHHCHADRWDGPFACRDYSRSQGLTINALQVFVTPPCVLGGIDELCTAIAAPAAQAEPSKLRALLSAGQATHPEFNSSGNRQRCG